MAGAPRGLVFQDPVHPGRGLVERRLGLALAVEDAHHGLAKRRGGLLGLGMVVDRRRGLSEHGAGRGIVWTALLLRRLEVYRPDGQDALELVLLEVVLGISDE